MRRRSLGAAAAAVALTLVPPLAATVAHAATAVDVSRAGFRGAAERIEALDLTCAARAVASEPVVSCRWTSPSSPLALGLRLLRLDPDTDPHRLVVFRSDELTVAEFTDRDVKVDHRYGYAVQAMDGAGRVVGRSRVRWVRLPPPGGEIEVLRLGCVLGSSGASIACEWTRPTGADASVVSLWRAVDGGSRQLVARFRPSGPTAYRDLVPVGASEVTYAVVVTSGGDEIVAQSRPDVVHVPAARLGPAVSPSAVVLARQEHAAP